MMIKGLVKKIFPKKLLNLRHLFFAWYGAVKYNNPSNELFVVGVTGTSGKSSTAYLLRSLLESIGFKVGSLTTLEFCVAGKCELNDRKMTMLGKMEIQKYLRKMADEKCDIAIIETTSEGYLQYRHKFINYDMMILTNLYPEHIESHGSFENYKAAKKAIFQYAAGCKRKKIGGVGSLLPRGFMDKKIWPKICVVNGDNEYAREFLDFNFDRQILFGTGGKARDDNLWLRAENANADRDGLSFTADHYNYHVKMFGEYNIMNILAVLSVAKVLRFDMNKVRSAVENFAGVPGRIEFIKEAEKYGFQVIVDYAFEPVALKELYKVVKLLNPRRIIHVCGSTGGGRDKARRIPIGKLVGERSDVFIVTDEDPYDEDPIEIIKTVSKGALMAGKILGSDLFEIVKRDEAIKKAINMAKGGDLVLITGKGSEQKMCTAGGKMIDWDDREIVRTALNSFKQIN